jgi:hypothetical protein
VAGYKQAGSDLTKGASYGTTSVTLGPLRDQLIAQMRATISKQDEQIKQLVKQNTNLEAIVHNTAGTHRATEKTAQHVTKPVPRSGAHGLLQRTGVPHPI